MTKIAEKIKKKIKEENLKPRPKAWFIIKHVLLATGAIISLVSISLALSLSWEILAEQELWALRRKIFLMLRAIPFFWIGVAVVIAVLAYFDLKNTKNGYKIRLWKILGGMSLICLILATVFYWTGVSQKTEQKLEEKVGGYHHIVPFPQHHWMQPEKGLLTGDILEISEQEIKLKDLEENTWLIIVEEDTKVGRRVNLEKGKRIKVLGEAENDFEFKAEFIGPENGGRPRLFK